MYTLDIILLYLTYISVYLFLRIYSPLSPAHENPSHSTQNSMARTAADTVDALDELKRILQDQFQKVRDLTRTPAMDDALYERLNEIFKIVRTMDNLTRVDKLKLNRMGRNHLAIAECSEEAWMILVGCLNVGGNSIVSNGKVTVSDIDVW